MSHTSTIKGVQIKDARAIRAAVEDLRSEGVRIELIENATPRMYYHHQEAEVGNCEFVLKLPGSRYDVGLKWNKEEGQYDAYLDTWAGEIRNAIGATCALPSDQYGREAEHAIGRFTQRYGINAAKQAAMAQGYYVESEQVDPETGAVNLVIAGM